jgi:hypothetical protein
MSFINRDYSYSEKDDYRLHVLPFKQAGHRIEGIYICRNPAMVLTGWNIVEGRYCNNDSSYPNSNPNLDPSRGNHGW